MNLSKSIFIICFLISSFGYSQLRTENLHYRSRMDISEVYFKDTITNHSSVLPIFSTDRNQKMKRGNGQWVIGADYMKLIDLNKTPPKIRFYPIIDLTYGGEFSVKNDFTKYSAGTFFGIDFTTNKFFATAKLLPYHSNSFYAGDSIQQNLSMDLGTTRPIYREFYQRSELLLAYRPNHIFIFIGGYGKNFFGEGYRSLLLSDNASNYPYFKIETTLRSIKYVNLYSIWNDNSVNPADKSLDKMKFSAIHYLSWNITRELNLSIFETVVWQAKDTLLNRGFDISYLNPVVFYRPVEYSNGSSDNVLLGANLSFKFNKNHTLYSQIILDEFLLSELKSDAKWWGNKFGIQLGYKSNSFLLENLYFQTEFNLVRPFTYSHKYSVQSYGHLNASVTHPLGANFYEILNILSYKKGSHRFTNKITIASYGTDTSAISYGQNIFASYSDRDGDYGHKIMQGLRQTVINETFIYEVPVLPVIDLYFNVTYNYRMNYNDVQTTHIHYLMIGIRSRLWNAYSDI